MENANLLWEGGSKNSKRVVGSQALFRMTRAHATRQVTRLRCELGWASERASDGDTLLVDVAEWRRCGLAHRGSLHGAP
jgi:hypothetical protein